MRRLDPHSRANWIVLGVGGAIATFVATARVLGGMHFISDVAGGAIVGTSLGMIVPPCMRRRFQSCRLRETVSAD
jgi:membrane-associated phospholipid phosphatase